MSKIENNFVSFIQLIKKLTLNQIQLLAFAIFSTQKNGETTFYKHEFEKKFRFERYTTKEAYEDTDRIGDLKFSTQDLENDKFSFKNIFRSITYDKGIFIFRWNEDMIPHILELKENYVLTDLTVTSKFKSGYSWILYDYLKAHYGYWHIKVSKDSLLKLFAVEDKESYRRSTSQFKNRVLNKAINEINKYTELHVRYEEQKVGRKIVSFTISWSTGTRTSEISDKQISLLRKIHDEAKRLSLSYLYLDNQSNIDVVKDRLKKIDETNHKINEELSSSKAKELIEQSERYYQDIIHSYQHDRQTKMGNYSKNFR